MGISDSRLFRGCIVSLIFFFFFFVLGKIFIIDIVILALVFFFCATVSFLFLPNRFSASTKCRFISRPFIQTSYGHLQKAFHYYHRKNWNSGGYWWSWWEALVRSINRRCLLCAGAVFLWDRERITNKEIKE